MEFTEEQLLLIALSRGDEKAFEVLFMRYFPRVKRFISGLLQDEITAEDFSQDILLRIWQKREEMVKVENLSAYLYQASRNAVYQHLRHVLLVNEYGEKQQEVLSNVSGSGVQDIEENMFAEELLLLVQHTVEQMPAQRRKIYEMSRKEGKTNDEIAQLLTISKRTVENHLTQALSDIRKMLKHFFLF
jgi:RNA polymerase sigma-70 factor (family 1)